MKFSFSKGSILILSLAIAVVFGGCAKGEGEGGAATITGKIMIQDYSIGTNKNGDPFPGYDVDVYIVYGNGSTYNDDFKTSYDGSYRFSNLRKGTYKIFVYSDIIPEPADPPKQEVMTQTVTISDKKETVTVTDITINQY